MNNIDKIWYFYYYKLYYYKLYRTLYDNSQSMMIHSKIVADKEVRGRFSFNFHDNILEDLRKSLRHE